MDVDVKLKGVEEDLADSTVSNTSPLGPLLLLTSIFFINFIGRVVLAPISTDIETDLGLTHAEAGSFFLVISFGYIVSLLGSGFVSARLNHKRTIILSVMTMGVALFGAATMGGVWGIRLSLILMGLATGLYLPSGIATLTALISPRRWGIAMAVHELAPNLGFMAAPLISEAIMIWFSWRGVFGIIGVAALLLGIAFARFGRGGEFPGEAPSFTSFRLLLVKPAFWLMAFFFCLGISGTLGIYSMLPLYLVTDHGFDRNVANTIVGLSRILGLIITFGGGWATDRLGVKPTLFMVLLVTGTTTILLGVVSDSFITLTVFLQPLAAVCFFPAGFAALSMIGPPKARNLAVSLAVPIGFLVGGGAVPTLIGFTGDLGSFGLGIAVVGGFILSGSILTRYLKFYEADGIQK